MHLFAWPYNVKPSAIASQGTSQVFVRLAFVTSFIRLEWIRFDTIKTHLVFMHPLTQVSPCSRLRESLSLLLPNF